MTSRLCSVCSKFYAREDTDFKCSQCFNMKNTTILPAAPTQTQSKPSEPEVKDVPARCNKCSRKVGLMGFSCKCEKMFCAFHQLPEDHDCKVDYKQTGCKLLEAQLEKVKAKKILEI